MIEEQRIVTLENVVAHQNEEIGQLKQLAYEQGVELVECKKLVDLLLRGQQAISKILTIDRKSQQ